MTTTFVKDSQTRVTRYGIKCFQSIDGVKCYAFAHADKKANNIVVSNNFSDFVDINGNSISGTYKIINTGVGKVANVTCEKV